MKLSVKSQACKPGTRFITFTASLDSPYWKVIYREQLAMSWGPATVFVHLRLPAAQVQAILRSGDSSSSYGGVGGHSTLEDEDEDEDDYELVDEESEWTDGNIFETDDFVVL